MSQRKITDIFAEKERTFSFEFYPPRTDKGLENLLRTAEELAKLGADYFSVTYGAGGAGSKATLNVVRALLERFDVPVMHHLTCVKHTFEMIRSELPEMTQAGVRNIMALRGDPPADDPNFQPGHNQPEYSYELVNIIREWGDWFSVGAAAFPEVHPTALNESLDTLVLRVKQESGADFFVTQLFFNNDSYSRLLERALAAGVERRIIPGVLPIVNFERVVDFCKTCGAIVTEEVMDVFNPIKNDPEAVLARGIEFTAAKCRDLLDRGAPGLHFYCLNRPEPVRSIVEKLGL